MVRNKTTAATRKAIERIAGTHGAAYFQGPSGLLVIPHAFWTAEDWRI